MGLIQRAAEAEGIPTVGISIVREYTEKVKPPRTVFVKWPFGHPLGEPDNAAQQKTVMLLALQMLCDAKEPGEIRDLALRWRREKYDDQRVEALLKDLC